MQDDRSAPEYSRRQAAKLAAAAAVGGAAWHTPSITSVDLRGARAAASSAPTVATVTATSFTRGNTGREFQHWGQNSGSTWYTVPFATGDVRIRVRRRATRRNATAANGEWLLQVNTVPTGCTSCTVTSITMTCPSGTATTSGVPGSSGNVRCASAGWPETSAVTATFTVTCT